MTPYDVPEVEILAVCHDCRQRHLYRELPQYLADATGQWTAKHAGHRIAFGPPRPAYGRRLLGWIRDFWSACPLWAPDGYQYGHNTDLKVAYAASAAYTISLASLATSSTRVAGRESDGVSNASNKYLDFLVSAKIRAGTTPTVSKQIDVWAVFSLNDTPTYPDVFDGTDSAETVTSENVRNAACTPLRSMLVDNTTDRDYYSGTLSLASALGSVAPMTHHVLFVSHDTAVNLNSTGGNHVLTYTPLYGTAL